MALLMIFSSIISLVLAEELPKPESLRQFGPYGRGSNHFGSLPNVRSSYSDGIAGNNILAVRRHLIKNHNTDPLNDYGNSGIEDFSNNGEYGSMDATRAGFDPLQGISASGASPQEAESHQNTLIQGSANKQSTQRQGRLEDTVNRQGHGGGGYNNDSGIDLYSILALGLFAAFLGYVIFYYISVSGRRRSLDLSTQEYATLIMAEVFNALERWSLVELMPSLKNDDESKLIRR